MLNVKKLAGVVIATPRLDESVAYYRDGYGLTLASQDASRAVFDGARGERAVLTVEKADAPALRGWRLALADDAAMSDARGALAAAGHDVRDGADGTLSVDSPDGQTVTFVADGDQPDLSPVDDGRPLAISHLVINSPQPARMVSFFTDVLGFKVTDRYERDLLVFLRADQPQHHCVGVSPGEAGALNHFSVDTGSIDGLMKGVGRMKKAGYEPIWGPGRHGPGGNVFCYFEDPTGFVAEFTCDVMEVDDTYEGREWERVPENANVWGTGGPTERAVALMSGGAGR